MFPITTNSLRPTLIAALCAAVAAAVAFPSVARAEIKIDGSVTVVEGAQMSGPVERATKDLLSDLDEVFGGLLPAEGGGDADADGGGVD